MSDNPNDRQGFGRLWLNRGIAAARAGKRTEAREALFRALNDESQRETAWLWLAAVSEDPRQERMYLEKVLSLNPDNRYGRAGLAHLEEKVRGQSALLAELSDETPMTQDVEAPPVGPLSNENPDRENAVNVSTKTESSEVSGKETSTPSVVGSKEPLKAKPAAPRPAPLKRKTGVEPPGGIVSKPRQRPVSPVQNAKEPTGWTSDLPVVTPPHPATQRATAGPPKSAEWWEADRGRVPPPAGMRAREMSVPRRRPQRSAPPYSLVGGQGRIALILNEAFNNHEMWTILASTLGLVLLAFVLAFFFTLSLLTP